MFLSGQCKVSVSLLELGTLLRPQVFVPGPHDDQKPVFHSSAVRADREWTQILPLGTWRQKREGRRHKAEVLAQAGARRGEEAQDKPAQARTGKEAQSFGKSPLSGAT